MTRAAPRTHLHSSSLVRQLADLASADLPASRRSFAEQLAGWLDVQDAITLSAALHPGAGRIAPAEAAAAPLPTPPTASASDPAAELAQVRDALRAAILSEGARQSGRTRLKLPTLDTAEPLDELDQFALYQRYYVAHQRDMDTRIAALRAGVRAAIAGQAPLRPLALLDAALDKTLVERERNLLAAVPLLLEKRFVQLRAEHRQRVATAAGSPADDERVRWLQPGGWLARFCGELQQLLLAELDLRLQPVRGLVDAYRQDLKKMHP